MIVCLNIGFRYIYSYFCAMDFRKGDKVIYLPTGEAATITRLVGKELVYIRMDRDKEELPAFTDDIAPVLKDERPVQPKPAFEQIARTFYREELKEGLYLIIQYKMGQLNQESSLPVFLYNHSGIKLVYDLNYFDENAPAQQFKGKLDAGGIDLIFHISFDSLEQHPTFEIDWTPENDPAKKLQCDVVIRPSAFFKKHGHIAIINSTGSMYYLQPRQQHKDEGSLSGYTKAEKRLNPVIQSRDPSRSLKEKAGFDPVLDLHIDKIHPDPSRLRKGDILAYQMKVFEQFVEKAIRLKVQQVFIVHGLGNGKLKDEIATRLVLHPGVNTFKNEFHPSFGFGATEVWLY